MAIPFVPIAMALAQFAPKLIGMLAGEKAEKTAEEVVNIASAVTGELDPQKALEKIKASGELQLKFQAQANEYAVRVMELELEDVKNARDREREISKVTGTRDINLYVLAYMFTIGFFVSIIVMVALILNGKLPEDMPEYVVFLLGSLFGTLTAGVSAVIQYFFGSSMGSRSKDRTNAANRMGGK